MTHIAKSIALAVIVFSFMVQPVGAQDPDRSSGDNYRPEGATSIKQSRDSRWVIYDRGDKTDWLVVSPQGNTENLQLNVIFEFVTLTGRAVIEVYGEDPNAVRLERKEVSELESYTYTSQTPTTHYFKLYVIEKGHMAKYTFQYKLSPLSTPSPMPTSTPTPKPTPSPTQRPTASPSPMLTPELEPSQTLIAPDTETQASLLTEAETPLPVGETMSSESESETLLIPDSMETPDYTPTPLICTVDAAGETSVSEDNLVRDPASESSSENYRLTSQDTSGMNRLILGGLILSGVVNLTLVILLCSLRRRPASKKSERRLIMPEEYKMLGDLAAEQEKYHLAEQCYRKIAELDPENNSIHSNLGIFLLRTERYAEAIKEFRIALEGETVDQETYDYIAYAYLAAGQLDSAKEYYLKAIETTPYNAHLYLGLGIIAQSYGQKDQAKEYYQKALGIDPNCQEARQNLEQIQITES